MLFLLLITFILISLSLKGQSLSLYQQRRSLSLSQFLSDVICINYIENWNYNYRKAGMQTTTDDVFVSLCAIYDDDDVSNLLNNILQTINYENNNVNDSYYKITKNIDTYVDLGAGIGSILLIVSNRLKPKLSIGLEAQEESFSILQKTLLELPNINTPNITSHLIDIRYVLNKFPHLLNTCDLITGNPPYLPISTGRMPIDKQRREARFETRGGIEDYCVIASKLLSPNGRFVCSFPTKDSNRIELAALKANLFIKKRYDLIMGIKSRDISIYNMIHTNNNNQHKNITIQEINIKRDKDSNTLSKLYMSIRNLLKLSRRPLKE